MKFKTTISCSYWTKPLTSIPESEKKLGDMDNKEFGQWLQKQDFKQMQTKIFDIMVPEMTIKSHCEQCLPFTRIKIYSLVA